MQKKKKYIILFLQTQQLLQLIDTPLISESSKIDNQLKSIYLDKSFVIDTLLISESSKIDNQLKSIYLDKSFVIDVPLIPIYSKKLFFVMLRKDIQNNSYDYKNIYQYFWKHPKYNTMGNIILIIFSQILIFLLSLIFNIKKQKPFLIRILESIFSDTKMQFGLKCFSFSLPKTNENDIYITKLLREFIKSEDLQKKILSLISCMSFIYYMYVYIEQILICIYLIKNYSYNLKNIFQFFFTKKNFFFTFFYLTIEFLIFFFSILLFNNIPKNIGYIIKTVSGIKISDIYEFARDRTQCYIIDWIYCIIYVFPVWYICSYNKKQEIKPKIKQIKMCHFVLKEEQLFIPANNQCYLDEMQVFF
jgi:hypothetical protein